MNEKDGWHYLSTIGARLIWSSSFSATRWLPHVPVRSRCGRAVFRGADSLWIARLALRERGPPQPGGNFAHRVQRLHGHHAVLPVENVGSFDTTASSAALIVASFPRSRWWASAWCTRRRSPSGRWRDRAGGGGRILDLGQFPEGRRRGESAPGQPDPAGHGPRMDGLHLLHPEGGGRFPAVTLSFYQTQAGFIGFPTLHAAGEARRWQAPTRCPWSMLLYLGTMCSVAVLSDVNFGLRKLNPRRPRF